MRALIVGLMLASTPAWACNSDMIEVEEWQIGEGLRGMNSLTVTYRNAGARAFRLISGRIIFADTLGVTIIDNMGIDPDHGLEPGQTAMVQDPLVYNYEAARLSSLHPDDIVITTCVRSVVYADGSREDF